MEPEAELVAAERSATPADAEKVIVAALGRAVGAARAERKMSMRAVAQEAGISQPFLSQIENGHTFPSLLTLYRLAKALGVSPADLMPGEADPQPIHLVRRGEGRLMPVSEARNAAAGRMVSPGGGNRATVVEYRISPDEDLGDWFESEGLLTVYIVSGTLRVEIEHRGEWTLGAGDAMTYPGAGRNRWLVVGPGSATILHVFTGAEART